jgi:hypothetical protein
MSTPEILTFEEFWPFYVKEHSKKSTRTLHFIGTTAAFACVAGAVVLKKRWLLALAPVVGYGPAWVSHFFIQKNRPATFKYPLWSLKADMVMWWKIARGEMDAEVERVLAGARAAEEAATAAPVAAPETVN